MHEPMGKISHSKCHCWEGEESHANEVIALYGPPLSPTLHPPCLSVTISSVELFTDGSLLIFHIKHSAQGFSKVTTEVHFKLSHLN